MKMQLNRDHVHVSPSGLSIEFKEGVPTHVPNRMVKEIISIGGTAAEEDKAVEVKALAEISDAQAENAARGPKIAEAIRTMHTRNQRGDFTAGGRPNLKTLLIMTGLEVSPEELEPIWNKFKAEMQ